MNRYFKFSIILHKAIYILPIILQIIHRYRNPHKDRMTFDNRSSKINGWTQTKRCVFKYGGGKGREVLGI